MNHEEKRQKMIKSKFLPNEFYFDCPFCNQRLLVDASLHNSITTCPNCNNEIVPIMNNPSQAMPTKKQTNVPSAVLQNFNGGHAVVNIYNQSGPAYTMYTKGKSRLTYILLGVFFGESIWWCWHCYKSKSEEKESEKKKKSFAIERDGR